MCWTSKLQNTSSQNITRVAIFDKRELKLRVGLSKRVKGDKKGKREKVLSTISLQHNNDSSAS